MKRELAGVFLFAIAIVGGARGPAWAQTAIDLRIDSVDFVIWGANEQDGVGGKSSIADLNGDGYMDLIFLEASHFLRSNPPVRDAQGRYCIFFGPFTFPDERDLLQTEPDTCILLPEENKGFIATDSSAVSIEDLDGDGLSELIISAHTAGLDELRPEAGSVAVFLGRKSWATELVIADADWTFHGADAADRLVGTLTGDLNSDGIPDLALFAADADGPNNTRTQAGEGYIFFGPPSRWTKRVYDLAVDAPDVHLLGADASDSFGLRLQGAITHVLGDDNLDLIVSAAGGDGVLNAGPVSAGEVYVFGGRSTWPTVIDLRSATPDLVVYGAERGQLSGATVGDWDGDGVADLVLGASGFSPFGRLRAGLVVVLFGGSLSGTWDLAVTPADVTIYGPTHDKSALGDFLWMADFNRDGYLDLIASAVHESGPANRRNAGAVFVLSACGIRGEFDLATTPADFSVYGADGTTFTDVTAGDGLSAGLSVGDIDNDGFADIFAPAPSGYSIANGRNHAGEIYLVRGRPFGAGPTCSIAADSGPGADICGPPTDINLDGAATIASNCADAPQYRWMLGDTVIQSWSPLPTVTVRPTRTSTYRLEVRCGPCGDSCFDSATVTVTVDLDVTPPTLGNTVRAFRSGSDVELSWGSVSEARTYSLYRGTQKESWPSAPLSSLTATTETVPDIPGPPTLYFYRVAGASCSGTEGP